MGEGNYGYKFLVMGFIVLVNAFFAGAETALVSVRKSRLQFLADSGNRGAQAALSLLASPERLLSVVQVGVTLASLALGWAGEEAFHGLLLKLLGPVITPATEWAAGILAVVLAFVLMTFLHVVVGEVIPKNLALDKSDRLAVLVAPVLLVFGRVVSPLVTVIERTAARLSRLLGVKGETMGGGGHSTEELKFIVESSRAEGHLEPIEQETIQRVMDLRAYVAREIMVPRNAVVMVPVNATLERLLRVMLEHQYSRYPVYEGTPDSILGVVHVKDLLPIWEERRQANARRRPTRPFQLRPLLRKPPVVPETKPLHQLLDLLRQEHQPMALVVDEHGSVSGIVTREDVLEQVLGEIEDEHDEQRHAPPAPNAMLELDGTTPIRDLETHYGLSVPAQGGFETLAGFLLYEFGRIPQPGDVVEHDLRRFTVLDMERNRIARVRVEQLAPEAVAAE